MNIPVITLEQNSNALTGQLSLFDSQNTEGLKVRIEDWMAP